MALPYRSDRNSAAPPCFSALTSSFVTEVKFVLLPQKSALVSHTCVGVGMPALTPLPGNGSFASSGNLLKFYTAHQVKQGILPRL